MLVSGVFNTSQTVQMANMVNFDSYGDFDPFTEAALRSDDAFQNPELPWLGIMGYNAHLVNPVYGKVDPENPDADPPFEGYEPYFQAGGEPVLSFERKWRYPFF